MMVHIYCKNYECPFNKKLKEPISFAFTQIYTPFEGDKCKGECGSKTYVFASYIDDRGLVLREGAQCDNDITENTLPICEKLDCLHNTESKCNKPEILVDKVGEDWVCRSFSQTKIKGHWDWFGRFLNPDGTAKGGHVDDDYAEKMHKYQNTTRSYRTHIKQVN